MILNAKITSADIFIEDHDILTFAIGIDSSAGWSTNIGNFYLDWEDEEGKKIPATGVTFNLFFLKKSAMLKGNVSGTSKAVKLNFLAIDRICSFIELPGKSLLRKTSTPFLICSLALSYSKEDITQAW